MDRVMLFTDTAKALKPLEEGGVIGKIILHRNI